MTDRVSFVGFRSDVGDLLAACDVVAVPSLREGLSISLLEAMAAGKAIIASSIGSQREVAAHGEMALLVPPGDARSLKDEIVRLAEDLPLMAHLAANARTVYETCYTEARMLEAYRQLYFDLLGAVETVPDLERSAGPAEESSQGYRELVPSPDQPKGGSV